VNTLRESPSHSPQPLAVRLAVGANLLLAGLVLALGGVLALGWMRPGEDPHGGIFALIGALQLLPCGLLFLLSAHALWRRWRARWAVQTFPFLYVGAFSALLGVVSS
jgi:hypothetical protein